MPQMKSRKPSILIVDDREENFIVLEALLGHVDYELVWANSGQKALTLAAQREFTLLLLDVQMPEMNGFTVLRRLKTNTQTADIPVIFITANYFSRDDEVKAYQDGVSDILLKPLIPEILISKVKVFIDLHTAANRLGDAAAVENERENFRNLYRQTPEMVCLLEGAEHRFVFVNEAHIKALGFDATGKTVREAQPESVEVHGILDRVYRTGETAKLNEIPVTLGERLRYFNLTYAATRDVTGEINGITILGAEVTEQVELREKLKESKSELELSNQKYRTFIEQTTEGIWRFEVDPIPVSLPADEQIKLILANATLAECNDAMARMYGFENGSELLGVKLNALFKADDPKNLEYLKAFIGTGYKLSDVESVEVDRYGNTKYFSNTLVGIIENDHIVRAWGSQRDITSEVHAEHELRDLANAIPQIVYMINLEGQATYLNDKWYDYTGASKDSLETISYVHPEDAAKVPHLMAKAQAARSTMSMEMRIKGRDQSYRWFMTRTVPRIEEGKLVGWYGTSTDIHERKAAQITFEKNVDVSPAILWITEKDGSCTYLSKQWTEFTGQPLKDALGYGWLEATHPDDKERAGQIFLEANRLEKPFYIEYRLQTKSGDYRWAIDAGNPRYNEAGEYLGYAGTVFDIHEQKMAHIALEENRERYKLLFESSPLPKWIFDVETFEFIDVNETAVKHYGYSREEFLNMKVTDIRPKEDVDRFELAMREKYRTDQTYVHKSYRHVKKDGTIISVEPSTHDLILNGRKARMAAVIDVTERLKSEERQRELVVNLEAAKNEAERANTLKSAFLANMSHEIRTPLGAMIGFADLLRDPGLTSSERSNYIDILARNGESLSVIINDILDLSKVEAGHLTLEYTKTSAEKVAADVLSFLRVTAKEKGLALELIVDESTPKSITSDPTRVRQVLVNLIGNAIKFTQFGSVTVRAFGCKTESGLDCVCFEVQDTGIGISDSQRERIFEMFVQGDGSMTRRFGGTGLGLALSRRLARSLGGDITISRTEEGRGTCFLFKIEDQPQFGQPETEAKPIDRSNAEIDLPDNILEDVRVLVVDDAPDNQQLIWRYLTKRGAKVDSAENGLEGYKKALTGNYDVILMDIQMPLMDGFTATAKLRTSGYSKPIIALTAHAMTEVRLKCFNVGCTEHLSKPINSKELIATVAKTQNRLSV